MEIKKLPAKVVADFVVIILGFKILVLEVLNDHFICNIPITQSKTAFCPNVFSLELYQKVLEFKNI